MESLDIRKLLAGWQDVIDLMAQIMAVPAGLVMRYEAGELAVFLSSHSENNPYKVGEKAVMEHSGLYCETVIRSDRKLKITNALADENWKHNPDVKLNMISYLGYPIHWPDQSPFGTICVLDNKENHYNAEYEGLVEKFRNLIESELETLATNEQLKRQQAELEHMNGELRQALDNVKTLSGLVPICANCKKIRDDQGYWNQLETYIECHTGASFSHGLCQGCKKELYGHEEWYPKVTVDANDKSDA